ncbi:unnamed protein product [Nyctereutes procyonoides]|uniref:(raccoon dog) hypothetical protein n=1 Tax=Nyctereutes procyonoides TaxID=34880 RepID=A0A811Z0V6_NYCPR|nr:unnamed protein product [Nyctereutes procyonoides]
MMWKDMDETFPCPKLLNYCRSERSKRKRQEEYSVCEKHNQFLTLFCGKNLEVLLEKVITLQASKLVELKKKVEFRREEILSEFEQIRLDILTKQAEHRTTFSGHVSTLRRLLKEVESKHMQSDLDFLTHLFLFQLKKYGFSLPPQYSGLDRILKPFQVDMILDLETAHPRLVRKKHLCYNPRRFYLCPPVLGSRRFSSGRRYWEVEVGNKPKWTLGGGFWAIGRYVESIYVMLGPKRTQFLPVVNPSKVDIFVDCELGEVSFYNMNDRSLLYTCNDFFLKWVYFF